MAAMTASWVDQTWLAVDTETTGIDVFADRIVEVACVQVHPDGTTGDEYCTIVNPGIEIPEGAAKVHGISTARAQEEGIHPAAALTEVAQRIFAHGHQPVVMFNASFDWPLMLSEAERYDIEFPFLAPVLDPFLVDKMMDTYRRGSRKLVAVAEHYAVELDEVDAHGARADAVAAARVMRQIIARYPQIGGRSLASVYLRQVRGYERWREGFVDHKQRQGDREFSIAPGWPIPAVVRGGLPVVDTPASQPAVEPAQELPVQHPPAAPAVGEEVAEVPTASATSTPKPERGISPADVAKLAAQVFHADYEAAARGQKTKVLERLRHAFTYACTGDRSSLTDLDAQELAVVYQRLHLLADGSMTYEVTDTGVSFGVPGAQGRAVIAWEQLELAGSAA